MAESDVESLRRQLSSFEIKEVHGLDNPNKKLSGEGSFGTVYEVLVDGVPRIAKQLHESLKSPDIWPSEKEGLYKRFYKECLLLSTLDHPNIVRFVGVHFGSSQVEFDVSLIMEKLQINLDTYLRDNPNVPIVQKLSILLDVSTGLLYLHSRVPPIIHRDLKPENILITDSEALNAKIADFGVSRALNLNPTRLAVLSECPGSLAYMPPEALQQEPDYGMGLDVFSFGEVCLSTIHQKHAEVYSATNDPELPAAAQRGEVEILKRKKWFDTMPTDHCCLHRVVTLCLKDRSDKRPSTAQLNKMMENLYDQETVPKTLEGFGYQFVDGRLRNIRTGTGFEFEVKKENKEYNQRHYEALGEVITEEVYKLLETRVGLKRVNIPGRAVADCSFFFMSDDALTADKLIVLIHGSGVVRAGQWARRLIINDCLESGTQLPYIERAKQNGYGIIVTNTNENKRLVQGVWKEYKDSGTPEEHASYVWKNYVLKAMAKHVDIVAHSYGGVVTVSLLNSYFSDFKKRVHKIALTNSAHSYNPVGVAQTKWRWLAERASNWVISDKPLDSKLDTLNDGVTRLSAGSQKSEETSHMSFESVFRFFAQQ